MRICGLETVATSNHLVYTEQQWSFSDVAAPQGDGSIPLPSRLWVGEGYPRIIVGLVGITWVALEAVVGQIQRPSPVASPYFRSSEQDAMLRQTGKV